MRPDPDTCRDSELLAAEVRRLRAVIDSGSTTIDDAEAARNEIDRLKLTRYERHCIERVRDTYADEDDVACNEIAAVLDGLLERTK